MTTSNHQIRRRGARRPSPIRRFTRTFVVDLSAVGESVSHELQPEGQLVPESGGIRLLASAENEITCRLPRLIDRAHERVVAEAFSEIIEECPAAHDWRVDCRDLKHLPVLLLGAFELGRDVITGAGNSFTLVLQAGALPLTILERVKARFLCIISPFD